MRVNLYKIGTPNYNNKTENKSLGGANEYFSGY